MPRPRDVTGEVFERLTAIKRVGSNAHKKSLWLFKCSCGSDKITVLGDVTSGRIKSCGCLHDESSKISGTANKIHGMHGSKEYICFRSMMNRCYSPKFSAYANYGGIGITVAAELQTFVNFIQYMGKHPDDGKKYTLDRLDNSIGYEIGNLRWATLEEQARNKGMVSRNTSGVTGVCWAVTGGTTYALASWVEDGKRITRRFSTKKFGLLPAFSLAYELRKRKIAELNEKGYGYTENHGK